MFLSYKNANIKLNNTPLFINVAQIGIQGDIAPVFLIDSKHTTDYVAQNGIVGSLRMSYYLTGADFLKNYILNQESPISGNIGGLYFSSGFLQSYSFSAAPNTPIIINAEVAFFEDLRGEFTTSTQSPPRVPVLHFSQVSLDQSGLGLINNAIELNYNYSSQVLPVYLNNDVTGLTRIIPNEYRFGNQQVSLDLKYDNLSGDLSIYGKDVQASISMKDRNGVTQESFTVQGKLIKKDLGIAANQLITNSITIVQNNTLNPPTITGYNPASGYAGDSITISGTNFTNVIKVSFGDKDAQRFTINSTSEISAVIAKKTKNGAISIVNYGGAAHTNTSFRILDTGIGGF